MGKEKFTKEKMIQLNSSLIGIPAIGVLGLMQYEDRSDKYSLTLKLMGILEKVAKEQKAWEQINKTSPLIDRKDANFQKLNGDREEKMNAYLQEFSDVKFDEKDFVRLEDLENLWHPEDAKKTKEVIDKEGRKRFTPQTIMSLQPILKT